MVILSLSARRAWIEIFIGPLIFSVQPSLSARRAWIEMVAFVFGFGAKLVALRKESVDRNHGLWSTWIASTPSLSARRAWIEIYHIREWPNGDRCRSPQGERG